MKRRIRVMGHYRKQIVGYRIVVDPDNPANEVEVPIYKTIYIQPYTKWVKTDGS